MGEVSGKIYKKHIDLYADYGDGIGAVDYVDHMGTCATFVNAARVSFAKHKEHREALTLSDIKLLKYMIKHKHTSPFEHASVSFRFKVPLYTRSQHHRHRTWSYNEISRRYTDLNIEFYEPNAFRTQHKSNRQASNLDELINPVLEFNELDENGHEATRYIKATDAVIEHHEASLELYEKLLAAGVCKEQARGVLGQDMYTEYYGTVNFSNGLKFIGLRDHDGSQEEIARAARAMQTIFEDLFPATMKAFKEIRGETNS